MEFCDMLNFYKKEKNLRKFSDFKNDKKENLENLILNNNYEEYIKTMDNYELESISRKSEYEIMKEKITNIITKYKDSLQYPFNVLLEYASSVYKTLEHEENIEKQWKKINDLRNSKNIKFIQLKNIQTEIVKNETIQRNLTKYLKSLNSIFEGYSYLSYNSEKNADNEDELADFLQSLKEFKKYNSTSCRKIDNINNLTLHSEYSEDADIVSTEPKNSQTPNHFTLITEKEENPSECQKLNEFKQIVVITRNNTSSEIKDFNTSKDDDKQKYITIKNSNINTDLDSSYSNLNKRKNSPKSKTNIIGGANTKKNSKAKIDDALSKTKNSLKSNNKNNSSNTNILRPDNSKNTKGLIINTTTKNKNSQILNKEIKDKESNSSNIKTSLMTKNSSLNLGGERNRIKSLDNNSAYNSDNNRHIEIQIDPSFEEIIKPCRERNFANSHYDEIEDKSIPSSAVFLIQSNFPYSNSQEKTNYDQISNLDQIDSVNDDSGVAKLNKILVRPTKISNRANRTKSIKSMPEFLNLKFEKPINNNTGCCVSCV